MDVVLEDAHAVVLEHDPVQIERVRDAVPADGVNGLGDTAIVASFMMVTGAKIDAAMASDARAVGLKPWSGPAAQTPEVVASTQSA